MDNQSLLIFWMSFPDGGRDPDQQKTTEYSIFHNVDKICMSWSCKIVEYKILTSENLAVPLNKCLKSQKIHQSIDFNEYSVKVRKMWSRKAVKKFWSSTQPLCLEVNLPGLRNWVQPSPSPSDPSSHPTSPRSQDPSPDRTDDDSSDIEIDDSDLELLIHFDSLKANYELKGVCG